MPIVLFICLAFHLICIFYTDFSYTECSSHQYTDHSLAHLYIIFSPFAYSIDWQCLSEIETEDQSSYLSTCISKNKF